MEQEYKYDVYMLCPVRNASEEEIEFLENYRNKLKEKGFNVLYPPTDTNQESDLGGYRICMDHADEILDSKTIHVYWNPTSSGSKVDLGSGLLEHKRRGLDILLMDRYPVEEMVKKHEEKGITKSYEHVLLVLDDKASNETRIN